MVRKTLTVSFLLSRQHFLPFIIGVRFEMITTEIYFKIVCHNIYLSLQYATLPHLYLVCMHVPLENV